MFPNIQPESPLNLMVECGGSQTQNISTAGSSSDFAALPHTCWHGADLGDTTTSASIASDRGRVPCARTHLQPTPLVLGAALPFPREELRPRSCGRRAIVAALPGAVAGRRSASLPRAEPGRAPGLCGRGRLRPSGRAAAARGERSPAVCASCGRCSSPPAPRSAPHGSGDRSQPWVSEPGWRRGQVRGARRPRRSWGPGKRCRPRLSPAWRGRSSGSGGGLEAPSGVREGLSAGAAARPAVPGLPPSGSARNESDRGEVGRAGSAAVPARCSARPCV